MEKQFVREATLEKTVFRTIFTANSAVHAALAANSIDAVYRFGTAEIGVTPDSFLQVNRDGKTITVTYAALPGIENPPEKYVEMVDFLSAKLVAYDAVARELAALDAHYGAQLVKVGDRLKNLDNARAALERRLITLDGHVRTLHIAVEKLEQSAATKEELESLAATLRALSGEVATFKNALSPPGVAALMGDPVMQREALTELRQFAPPAPLPWWQRLPVIGKKVA